jgi:hypothetical protein
MLRNLIDGYCHFKEYHWPHLQAVRRLLYLKMEATGKLVSISQITWHHISEDHNLPTGLPLPVPSMHYVA